MGKNSKLDKVTCSIIAAFVLLSGSHFACRYDVGAMVDNLFHKVSAETVLPDAPTPAPLGAAPVTTSTVATSAEQPVTQKIARNPFLVPIEACTMAPAAITPAGPQGPGYATAVSAAKSAAPALRGVVRSGNKSMAIIEYHGSSQAYNVGQDVGEYSISSIGSGSATLSGPDGAKTISIGG